MAGSQTSTRRSIPPAVVVALLVIVVTVGLRGHVPGAETPATERPPDDPASSVIVLGLLAVAVAVVVTAVIVRVRRPMPAAAPTSTGPAWLRSDRARPTWRVAVIAFGVIVCWLLIFVLLSRWEFGGSADPTLPEPAGSRPAAPEASEPVDAASAPPEVDDRDWDALGYLYVATAVFLVVLVVGSVLGARRRPGPTDQFAAGEAEPRAQTDESETLARAAEVGLAEVGDTSRDPRHAIIACYAAMERELARVPGAMPRDFDTASEVLDRAVAQNALQPDSAIELVDLFDEARFSPHVMTEAHRDAAVAVLRRVLDELRVTA
ncbi:hypothetical protein MARA_43060 [Mycolicibacterium arabiense]|uniref:Protein-glutamine gamma-glutamyltransferase-like C-terminal domain-containing protein n=1 Tax=Mycolicibacterium arabiense TaxID=1286181 RepID=A0A7I7S1P6_9MYCO|nr:DUF4129 domain-containing protein [Mycolicibacterium arabiense]MCV7375001.1 DUF4129 domain-containing protein [Mycolicibacterium arabiense]BBY50838.1 hypothetical protein MARA_43060 [Mycolicibacterium arabiense]